MFDGGTGEEVAKKATAAKLYVLRPAEVSHGNIPERKYGDRREIPCGASDGA